MITIETTSVSAVRAASRVEGRLYFNKLHKTASGKYRGCAPWAGGVLAKQAYLRYACTASGTVITIPDIVVEPTTDALIGNDVRATFALFDADTGKLLMIIAEEVRLPASPSMTSWAALKGAVLTVPAVPAAPVATAIASDDVSVVITAVSGAATYKLQRKTGSGSYVDLASGLSAGTYHDATTDPLTSYTYKVLAHGLGGDSAYSAASNTVTTPQVAAPSAPVLSASYTGVDAHLTTTATPRATSYLIYRDKNSGGYTLIHTSTVSAGAALDYHDTDVTGGDAVAYKVKGSNAGGDSGFSNIVSGTIAWASVDPATVTGRLVGYDSDNATVSTWTDSSSNANNAAQATSGKQPVINSADINGHKSVLFDATDDTMALTTPLTTVKSGLVVLKCDTPDSGANLPAILGDGTAFDFAGSSGTLLLDPANAAATLRAGDMFVNGFPDAPINVEKPAAWRVVSFRTSGSAVKVGLIANDRNVSSRSLNARYARIELFDSVLTDANLHGMETFLMSRYAITETQVLRRQIVSVGDSQTAGGGWQVRSINCLAGNCAAGAPIADKNWYYSTHALSGYTLDDMSVFDSAVAADFNPHRLKQVVVIWGGTNDLYHGASGATAYTRLLARVNAYKAAGYTKIIVVNCLKRIDSGTPGGYETERADFNSRVAAGVATEGWVLADIAAVTNLQDPSDTTYFLDGVHLSGTGQDQMSPVVRDAVNAA